MNDGPKPCPACGALPCDQVRDSHLNLHSLLNEALNLCVRAKKLDEMPEKGSMTPALWVLEQYEKDLDAWQKNVMAAL